MFSILKKLFYLFDRRTRLQFLLLFGLMLLGSILEAGGVGLIVPFITVVADPGIIESNKWLHKLNEVVGTHNPTSFLIYMSIGLVVFYVIKNIFIGVMNYLQFRFVHSKRASLGKILFRLYLKSPYTFHLERNTAELDRNIRFEANKVYIVVQSLLKICTELSVVICVMIMLLLVNPIIVIFSIITLGVASGVFHKVDMGYSRIWGEKLQSSQKHAGQSILEGFGAIKEVKISGSEDFFSNRYYSNMIEHARAYWKALTLNSIPRLLLEVCGAGSVVLIITLLVVQGKQIKIFLPTLSLFAMATIRLMPSISWITSNLQQIRFNSPAVDVIYEDVHNFNMINPVTPKVGQSIQNPLSFKREISLQNLGYAYPNSDEKALHGVSLKILKGQSVGFVGPSGAGKTTLVNLILGLLVPSEGKIYADEQDVSQHLAAWQQNIGYVPQSIYLLDADILSNVAFGLEEDEIDNSKVCEALKIAQLDLFVKQLPDGLNTFVGENGVRISGGQRQRLGIARAIYHQPEILILDEATSALDNETEKELSRAIEELSGQKTLIIIAHRLSTIMQCDNIYFMEKGSVVDSGTFNELLLKNPDFKRIAESGKLEV